MLDGDLGKTAFANLLNNIEDELATYQTGMNNVVAAGSTALPIIGKKASDLLGEPNAPAGIENVNAAINAVRNALNQLATNVSSASTASYAQALVQQTIFDGIGAYLADNDDAGIEISASDVRIVEFNPDGGNVTIDLNLKAMTSFVEDYHFNLGLPGFPFQVISGGEVHLGIAFGIEHFRFGAGQSGFFVDTNVTNRIKLDIDAGVSSEAFRAQFGFLEVQNREGRAIDLGLSGSLLFDVGAGGISNPEFHVNAHAIIPFETLPVSIVTSELQMPQVRADLELNWAILDVNANAGLATFGATPEVKLTNVEFQIGGLMEYIVGPLVKYMRVAMAPQEIFVGAVTFPIPGFSDIWEEVFDRQLSILEIANILTDVGVVPPPYSFIVDAVNFMKDFTSSISALTDESLFSTDIFSAYMPLGTIDFSKIAGTLNTHDLRSDQGAWGEGSIAEWLNNPLNLNTPLTSLTPYAQAVGKSIDRVLAENVPQSLQNNPVYQEKLTLFRDKLDSLNSGISLSFPIIQDPVGSVFKLFVGQDFQLVNFTVNLESQRFDRDNDLNLSIDDFPVDTPITFTGDMVMDFHLNIGYDTRGLRSTLNGDPFGMFDGFNFDLTSGKPLLRFDRQLNASLSAGIDLGPFAGAGAELSGFIRADNVLVNFVDEDGDGYFRPFNDFNPSGSLFNVQGAVTAGIQAGFYVKTLLTGKDYLVGPIRFAEVPIFDLRPGRQTVDTYNHFPDILKALRQSTKIIPRLSVSDAIVMEGSEGTKVAQFTVSLNVPSTDEVRVNYASVLSGTASVDDFAGTSGTLVFAPNEMKKTIEIAIHGDTRMDDNETFSIALTEPVDATIADNFGLGTIVDEDTEAHFRSLGTPYDATWDGDGLLSTDVPDSVPGSNQPGRNPTGSMLDPDGRLVVFGSGFGDNAPTAVRYLPNGQLDTTFGAGGIATYTGDGISQQFGGAVYQSGPNRGKILVVGQRQSAPFTPFTNPFVVRFNIDGTLDTTFGPNGQGWISIDLAEGFDGARDVAIYESGPHAGKFVISSFNGQGRSHGATYVSRHDANGSLDATFGTSGSQKVHLAYDDSQGGNDYTELGSIKLDAEGRLILAGQAGYPGTYSGTYLARSHAGAVVRLKMNGALDTDFGTGGVAFSPTFLADGGSSNSAPFIEDIDVLPDGKILGAVQGGVLVRFSSNGVLEYTSPTLSLPGLSRPPGWKSLAIDSQGRVYVTGGVLPEGFNGNSLTEGILTVARYVPQGNALVPDPTFDVVQADGALTTPGFASGVDLQVSPDANLAVAGWSYAPNGRRRFGTTKYETGRNDLSATVSRDTSAALSTGLVVYTIRVSNTGDDADFASIKSLLPAHAKLISAAVPSGWTVSPDGTTGEIVAATRELTQANGEQVITLTVDIRDATGAVPSSLSNTVVAGSATLDYSTPNNSVTVADTIETNLGITALSSNIDVAPAGSLVAFALCATNDGPTPANYRITTTIPAGSQFVSATGNYTLNGNVLTWNGDALASGGHARQDFVVQAIESGYLQATASVAGISSDETPANNIARSVSKLTPPGLVSYWKADTQGPGGVVYDSVGSNDGTLVNGATLGVGNPGQAFQLNIASQQYVNVPDSSSLESQNFTISARFTANSINGLPTIFSKTVGSSFLDSYSIWFQDGNINAIVSTTNDYRFVSIPFNPTPGTWYQTAMTFETALDGSRTLTLYLFTPSGVQQVTTSVPFAVAYDHHPFRIGMDIENEVPSYFWDGKIDEVYFFNEVLTQNQIANLDYSGSIDVVNQTPTIEASNSSVTFAVGQPVVNSGTLSDVDGLDGCVLLSASLGTVSQSATNRNQWDWSYTPPVGFNPSQSVVITVNDGRGGVATTSFNLSRVGPALPGDYAGVGVVDARSYISWRKQLGKSVPSYSGADGSGNGIVGPEDLSIFFGNYGNSLGSASNAGSSSTRVVTQTSSDGFGYASRPSIPGRSAGRSTFLSSASTQRRNPSLDLLIAAPFKRRPFLDINNASPQPDRDEEIESFSAIDEAFSFLNFASI